MTKHYPDSTITDAKIDAVDDYVDTEVAAIKAKTDIIGASVALESAGNLAAVKAKTDALPTSTVWQHQADSVTIIASPVSGTKYEWLTGNTGAGAALGTQNNVRILSAGARLTWATTQPTPLEVHITIDGVPMYTHQVANPVTATDYMASLRGTYDHTEAQQILETTDRLGAGRPFLYEGRAVKVEIEITWATTQPTNLSMRVKWAKIP